MTLVLTTAPTTEPVTNTELKDHLRLDQTTFAEQQSLLDNLIKVARAWVEDVTNRQLLQGTWTLYLDEFPGSADTPIRLIKVPVVSVTSVKYLDTDGTQQTWAASKYRVDKESEPGRIYPAYGEVWPTARDISNAVEVAFVAGYASAGAVPQGIKHAILMLAAHLYEHPEATVPGAGALTRVPLGVESFVWQYRSLEAV